ncbi:hypothetical protein OY671_000587 [Metschnikowia pulcherrima]|nr:hypothetical protein OY671_000587 [Metschnikowia pulcherrima]
MSSENTEDGIRQYFGQPEARLNAPISCQVMQIFNVSESKEKALEEWRYYHNPNKAPFERMEHVSRPIIYGVDLDATEHEQKARSSKATYKLLLRDPTDNYFYAVELEDLPFLRPQSSSTKSPLPIVLGGKLTLQHGTLVSDGIVLLRKHQCAYEDPDPASESTKSLNEDIVQNTIDLLERLLEKTHPSGP